MQLRSGGQGREVLQVVLEQQLDVAILDLLACGHVGEIDQRAIEVQHGGNEDCMRHCAVTGFSVKSWAASGP